MFTILFFFYSKFVNYETNLVDFMRVVLDSLSKTELASHS